MFFKNLFNSNSLISFTKQKKVALFKLTSFNKKFHKEFRETFYEFLLFMDSPRSTWIKIIIIGGLGYACFEWCRSMLYFPDVQKFLLSPRLAEGLNRYHNSEEDATFMPQEEVTLKKFITGSTLEKY